MYADFKQNLQTNGELFKTRLFKKLSKNFRPFYENVSRKAITINNCHGVL